MSQTQQTISTLVREAAKSEANFLNVLNTELLSDAPDRIEEFFAKLNIPRSTKADDTLVADLLLGNADQLAVTTFADEVKVAEGIQKFMDRHMRKLKWHVAHPAQEGITNCVRLFRAMGITTELRVLRILALMKSKQRLTVAEWGSARELLNRAYRELREATAIVTGPWIDALLSLDGRQEVLAELAPFAEMVARYVKVLETLRRSIEERRKEMEVKPEGYPVVRPPRYFGGDLLDTGSWKHFWGEISGMSDALGNILGQ
ncbi:MAG: hypothetical protein ABIO70_11370 [Pseudomonadota bacterium]